MAISLCLLQRLRCSEASHDLAVNDLKWYYTDFYAGDNSAQCECLSMQDPPDIIAARSVEEV